MTGDSKMINKTAIYSIENISKNFGTVEALKNVSFSLKQGKILGLVGDNGAGKSTMLKILSGGLHPTDGKIYIEGKEVHFKSTADAMNEGIAIAYQFLELVETAKVWENFFMGREVTKKFGPFKFLDIEKMKKLTLDAVEKHGKTIDVEQEVRDISGEEKQTIAITRALESNPKILLLDESFTLLSMEGREEIVQFLKKVNNNSGITMVIVSHDLDLIKKLSHYIMVLRSGEKMFFGRSDEISADEIVNYMLP